MKFFARTPSMIRRIVRFEKLGFFLRIFRSDTIENQGIIYLSSYSCKCLACLIPNDFEVVFLGDGEDVAFFLLLYCILFI